MSIKAVNRCTQQKETLTGNFGSTGSLNCHSYFFSGAFSSFCGDAFSTSSISFFYLFLRWNPNCSAVFELVTWSALSECSILFVSSLLDSSSFLSNFTYFASLFLTSGDVFFALDGEICFSAEAGSWPNFGKLSSISFSDMGVLGLTIYGISYTGVLRPACWSLMSFKVKN